MDNGLGSCYASAWYWYKQILAAVELSYIIKFPISKEPPSNSLLDYLTSYGKPKTPRKKSPGSIKTEVYLRSGL